MTTVGPPQARHADLAAALDRARQRRAVGPVGPAVAPGAPVTIEAPLTAGQQQIWLGWALDPAHSLRHVRTLVVHGPLERAVLDAAVDEVLEHADALRCSYPLDGDLPRQRLHPSSEVPRRWRDAPDEPALRAVLAEAEAEAATPIDLRSTLPTTVTLVRRRSDEHLVLIVCHHLAIDGWSTTRLAAVLHRACRARTGDEHQAEPAPPRFLDVVAASPAASTDAADRHPVSGLLDGAEPIVRWTASPAGADLRLAVHQLDPAAVARLQSVADVADTTLFAVLLGTVFIVLGKACSLRRPLVGVPLANRPSRQAEAAIGRFSLLRFLAGDLRGEPTVGEVIARTGRALRTLLDPGAGPTAALLGPLTPAQRLLAGNVVVQLQNFDPAAGVAGAPHVVGSDLRADGTRVLSVTGELLADGSLRLVIRTMADPDAPAELTEVAGQIITGLHRAVRSTNLPWHALTDHARHDERTLPGTAPDAPLVAEPEGTVLDALRVCTSATPGATAVDDGQVTLTYAELASRAETVTATLLAAGLRPGETVAITGPRTAATVVAMVGTLAAGGVMMPLPTLLPPGALDERLAIGGARIELTTGGPSGRASMSLTLDTDGTVRSGPATTAAAIAAATATPVDRPEPTPGDPAYLFFTSGTSSGRARAVMGRHGSLRQFIDWQRRRFRIGTGDRVAMFTGLGGDVTLRNVFLPLLAGGCVVVAPDELDPLDAAAWLAAAGITVLHVTPTLAEHILRGMPSRPAEGSLCWTFFAGEPLTASLVRRWRGRMARPGAVVNLYGPTETTMARAAFLVPDVLDDEPLPVGWALPGSELLILDDDGEPVPSGMSGEVVIRTCHGTLGYRGDPEGWASRATYEPGTGVLRYRTRDRGHRRADGAVVVSGRLDDEVKIADVRIEPADIAARIRRVPGVAAAEVVVVRPGAAAGAAAEPSLAAAVVRTDPALTAAQLRRTLAEELPALALPRIVRFVDHLPVAPSGKVDRGELHRLLQPRPTPATPARIIARLAGAEPDRPAFVTGDRTVCRGELDGLVTGLAGRLSRAGVRPGSLVGVTAEAGVGQLVALLAVHRCGAGYLPLPADLPPARRDLLLEDVALTLVIADRIVDGLPAGLAVLRLDAGHGGTEGETATGVGRPSETADGAATASEVDAGPDDLAYVIGTSGSTGRPSPVAVSHRALDAFVGVAITRYGLGPQDRLLRFHSYGFDASVEEIFCTLAAGGTLVDDACLRLGAVGDLLRHAAEQGVTVLDLPTSYWHVLVDELHDATVRMPESVRLVIIGGAAADPDAVRRWHRVVGDRVRLINTYGPTECTVAATTADLVPGVLDGTGRVPIGIALPGVATRLDGAELLLGGPQLAQGYLGRPELDAARFVTLDGTRWYRTGDRVAVRPDGGFDFLGRVDDQVKIRGVRVEPGEIEATLRRLPGVRDAVVLGHLGADGQPTLTAHVETADHTAAELRRALATLLPVAFVPTGFVVHHRLPRTPGDKPDRAALREAGPAASGQVQPDAPADPHRAGPDRTHPDRTHPDRTHPDRTHPDRTGPDYRPEPIGAGDRSDRGPAAVDDLVQLWREVLDEPEAVADTDFFEAGGHSLLAVRLFGLLERRHGVSLPLSTLFEHPTPATLASRLAVTVQPTPAGRTTPPRTPAEALAGPSQVHGREPATSRWRAGRDPASWLVTMRHGMQGTPLHLAFPSGGFLFHYERMVAHYPAGRTLRGVEARGISGSGRFAPSVEAMGIDAASAIRTAGIDRPVLLGGFSSGALVAFEAARRLLLAGIPVAALVLLDPPADWNRMTPPQWYRRRSGFRADLQRKLQLRVAGVRGRTVDPVVLGILNHVHHRRVLPRYRPAPLPRAVPALLVRSEDRPMQPCAGPAVERWTLLTGAVPQLLTAAGTHLGPGSFLQPPRLAAVTVAVERFLDEFDR